MASTYLSKSVGSINEKTFTVSFWVKRGKLGDEQHILGNYVDNNNRTHLFFRDQDNFQVFQNIGGTAHSCVTHAKFRDVNGWYHFVVAIDTTQATASNRCRIYVNGVEQALDGPTYHNQNTNLSIRGTHYIGYYHGSTSHYFDGSLSHLHFIDGTAYDASAFGETDSTTGEWKIKTSPSVTYGTEGYFILKDGNSVTNQAGNSAGNFSVSGGTLTKTEDCPSNVFCTLNPLMSRITGYASGNATSLSFSNGNTYAGKVTHGAYFGTIGVSSGKFYWEVKVEDTNQLIGIVAMRPTGGVTYLYDDATINGYYPYGNNVYTNGSSASGGPYDNTSNKIYSFALDAGNNKLWVGRDGSFTGDPANGTGATWSSLPTGHDWTPVMHTMSTSQNNNAWFNFGNGYFGTTAVSSAGTNASGIGIFEYDVPTGYTALSTKGLNE